MEKKIILLPADDAVQNWFEENIDKECSTSSAIYKFRLWLESLQVTRQPGLGWVKGNIKPTELLKSYYCRLKSNIDGHLFGKIVLITLDGQWQTDWEVVEWLDESATPANVLPTFWDVAKAFKWAAEHKTEKGESLMLADGWCLIHEGGVTEELTPGNVAELYCLQNGFTKEIGESPAAGREEDAVEFAEWAATIAFFDDGTRLWELIGEGEAINGQFRFTTKEFYQVFKQKDK